MDKKMLVGVVLFGSIWGMLECILGDLLRDNNLPAGAVMSGIVAITLMTYTRMVFKKRGMQLGMAGIASALRLTNPFTGCLICSAIAILIEGIVFELIWYNTFDLRDLRKVDIASLGVVTAYLCYVSGFIATQILTPLLTAMSFNVSDLFAFMPQILAKGLPAGILGAISLPLVSYARSYDIRRIKSSLYYPATACITLLCWVIAIVNAMM